MNVRRASTPRLRRKGFWLRLAVVLLLLGPVLFWLLSNLFLQSGWGVSWLAAKISQRTGMSVSVGSAGWLPGGQMWLDDLRVHGPAGAAMTSEPWLHVRCISVRPAWSSWIRGSRKISDIHLTAPRMSVSMETLKQFLPQPAEVQAAPVVAVAGQTPPQPVATPPEPPAQAPSPTVWLHISDGTFSLSHPKQVDALLEMNDVTATIPIAGAPAQGFLSTGAMRSFGQTIMPNGRIDMRWTYPRWETEEVPLTVASIRAEAKGQLARVAGMPFTLVIAQTPQSWQDESLGIAVTEMQSLHRMSGYLIAPQSWMGESQCQSGPLHVRIGQKNQEFFALRSHCQLLGGVLFCRDFRLLGEHVALLANGMLNTRGEGLGIVRLTAPRAAAIDWENHWRQLFPEHSLTMPFMGNEDRRAIDILCGGSVGQPWVSFNQGQTLLSLPKIIELWQQYQPTPLHAPSP
jgi:hypothetical protein